MQIPKQALLLRIFIGEDDTVRRIAAARGDRAQRLANCTWPAPPSCAVAMGFGASSRLHTTKILRLSEDLPLVIEIVDSEDKINGFLPTLDQMMSSGLITLEKVQVLHYGAKTTG